MRESLVHERTRTANQMHGFLLADDDLGSRLLSMPCVGPITASLLAVAMGDGKQYRCSRGFAAFVGLVPRQFSTGGKANLLGISKRADRHLRQLLRRP